MKEWNSTHAISLEQFDKKNKHCPELDFNLLYVFNLWDFGGQDIYHATHRLFMQANAIYLLFWDAETEERAYTEIKEQNKPRKYPVHRLPYWLAYATTQGEESPVLAIQTKTGKHEKQTAPNQDDLLKEYKDVLQDFYHIESEEDDWEKNGYTTLLYQIQRQAKRIKKNSKILNSFIEIREYIRSLQSEGNKTLELNEFIDYAEKKGFTAAITPLNVLNWLVQTGVVFYRKGLFEDKIILNQEWVISAIYTLFDRTNKSSYYLIKENKGHFSGKELSEVWESYSDSEKELFVSFMKSCEMCFETTPQPKEEEDRYKEVDFEERTFVAPQMLPNKEEDYFWDGRESLFVRYHQHFMHKGIMESFIFRTQEKYTTQTIKLWNGGIRLKTGTNEFAEVEHINDQELQIRITPNAKDLLNKIRNLIDEVQGREIDELVSADRKNFVSLNRLEKMDISQNKTILSENGTPIEIEKLLIFLNQDKQTTFKMKQNDLHPTIQKAVKCLQNANYSDYFATLDTIPMPLALEMTYAAHKGKFINGKTDWDFPQQLVAFTDSLNKQINPSSNSTIMQDPTNNPKNEGSNTYVTVNPVFHNNSQNTNTSTNTNNNTNSQSQQVDFKQFVSTLENLQRNFRNLQRDVEEKLEEDSDNKELQKAKKDIEKTIEAAEIVEIEAKKADEAGKENEEAKSSIKKDKAGFFYYVGRVATYFPKLAQSVTNPQNWQNAKESLEKAQAIGGQLGL